MTTLTPMIPHTPAPGKPGAGWLAEFLSQPLAERLQGAEFLTLGAALATGDDGNLAAPVAVLADTDGGYWLVQGCDWQTAGEHLARIADAGGFVDTDGWHGLVFGEFVGDVLRREKAGRVSVAEAYDAYTAWCNARPCCPGPWSVTEFLRRLIDWGYQVDPPDGFLRGVRLAPEVRR